MTQLAPFGTVPIPPPAGPPVGSAQSPSIATKSGNDLAATLDAYHVPAPGAHGSEDTLRLADSSPRGAASYSMSAAFLRLRRAASEFPTREAGPREAIAGVPFAEDFGIQLLDTFRQSTLSTWERADLMEQAFTEWRREGPSPQAATRLQSILAPGYVDTPEEPKGAVIMDALALHLIDRGRYAPLVRDYIDSLERTGEYDSLIDALLRDFPDKNREWASRALAVTLHTWNEPLPADLRAEDASPDEPAFDMNTRIQKLYRLMNPNARRDGNDGEGEGDGS